MKRALAVLLPFVLAGCTSLPAPQVAQSACALHEASWACQVERYHNVSQ